MTIWRERYVNLNRYSSIKIEVDRDRELSCAPNTFNLMKFIIIIFIIIIFNYYNIFIYNIFIILYLIILYMRFANYYYNLK